MESSLPSPAASDMAEGTPSISSGGPPTSSDFANPGPPKPLERKVSSKIEASPQDAQQQPEEPSDAKQVLVNGNTSAPVGRIEALERELEKAKESERKMLQSLFLQTTQLEQTKIELEEAKLELRNLRESSTGPESLADPMESSQDELPRLKRELELAIEAEENSKKAMDSLAIGLSDVTAEMNQVKSKLSETQSKLQRAREEADQSKSMLKSTTDKLQLVLAELDRLRQEADEASAVWSAKEKGFMACIKASEEEAAKPMKENGRLLKSHKAAREENSKPQKKKPVARRFGELVGRVTGAGHVRPQP